MGLTRLSIAGYAALIFVSGVAVGVFGQRLYSANVVTATKAAPRSDDWRKRYMDEMQTRLKLRPQQVTKLNMILDETRTLFHEVHERSKPELDTIRMQQIDKIKQMLDEGQRPEYDKMRAEREQNMQKSTPRSSVPPGL